MKIKKMKENFEDMKMLLFEAVDNGLISEKKYNRYTETLESAAEKLDELKALKLQMKSQEQIIADARSTIVTQQTLRDFDDVVPESCRSDEETEQEYDEEDEYDDYDRD